MISEARKRWYQQRREAIHEQVTVYDVLRLNGIDLKQAADDRQEQISCPFHGKDTNPSARIYPADGDRPSRVWCFVCQEKNWDAIGLWAKFNGLKYAAALSSLERHFNLETPEAPSDLGDTPEKLDAKAKFRALYGKVETRLISCRVEYKLAGDRQSYLAASRVLDKVSYRVEQGSMSPVLGIETLQTLLERIGARVRSYDT